MTDMHQMGAIGWPWCNIADRLTSMREAPHVLGIVLAGGEGKRLYPLTADRAKPAVPFGGSYPPLHFVLSNLVNARFLRDCGLTQYKSHSLGRPILPKWGVFRGARG